MKDLFKHFRLEPAFLYLSTRGHFCITRTFTVFSRNVVSIEGHLYFVLIRTCQKNYVPTCGTLTRVTNTTSLSQSVFVAVTVINLHLSVSHQLRRSIF